MTPQIIRTLDEIDALDPETLLIEHSRNGGYPLSKVSQWVDSETGKAWEGAKKDLPAVVIATGDTVRAARQALEEA